MKKKQPKLPRITVDKLAAMTQHGFSEVNSKINILQSDFEQMKIDFGQMKKQNNEILTGQAEILGKLEKWEQENLAGAQANKRFEDRIYTLEQDVKVIKEKIKM